MQCRDAVTDDVVLRLHNLGSTKHRIDLKVGEEGRVLWCVGILCVVCDACDVCDSLAAFYSPLQPPTASYNLLQHELTPSFFLPQASLPRGRHRAWSHGHGGRGITGLEAQKEVPLSHGNGGRGRGAAGGPCGGGGLQPEHR